MKYKYIVFDFNGTIIDDVDLCLDLLNQMLILEGLKTFDVAGYREIFTFPIIEYYKRAGITFKNRSFKEMSEWFVKEYQPRSMKCNLYDGIKETLEELNHLGYKVILLSASQIDNLTEQIINFDIHKYFFKVLGIDNIEARSKLDIARNYFLEQGINTKECLFIGDSTHDYEVASTLGGDCLLITHGHQSERVLSECNVPVIRHIFEVKKYL